MTRPVVVFTATKPHDCPMPDSDRLTIGSLAQCSECHQVCRLESPRNWVRDHNPGTPIVSTPVDDDSGIIALRRVREDTPYAYIDERGNYVDEHGKPDVSPAFAMLGDPGQPERRNHEAKPVAFALIVFISVIACLSVIVLAATGHFG